MPLLFVFIGILFLLLLMLKFKFDAFFSLLLTAFFVGILNSMNIFDILNSMLKGVGSTMGSIVLILVFGAMLGKLIEESGAAHTITNRLTTIFGEKYIQYAILITGFLVGLPMMYNASFLVLIPLVYTLSTKSKLPLMYLGIPLSATLSIAHGYLPPHPAPTYVSFVYGADINHVLLIGLVPVIPACLIAGILLSRFFKRLNVKPPKELYTEQNFEENELPGLGISVFSALTPVILMLLGAIIDLVFGIDADIKAIVSDAIGNNFIGRLLSGVLMTFKFMSNANMALMIAVLVGIYTLGIRQKKKMTHIMKNLGQSVNSIAMIIMIIAAGGAFKQVLTDSGVAEYIKDQATGIHFNPLILAWSVAAVIRLAIGSATVATMTAAGIMLPIVASSGVSPELMVLATGSGSLMFSHFNDVGFWMFKEYYNVSIKQTFAIWTVMESLVAIIGLITALALSIFL